VRAGWLVAGFSLFVCRCCCFVSVCTDHDCLRLCALLIGQLNPLRPCIAHIFLIRHTRRESAHDDGDG
jgi:hypothetical protein